MNTRYSLAHGVATAIGVAAIGYQTAVLLETFPNVSTVTKIGMPLATVAAALLPVIAEAAWYQGSKARAAFLVLPILTLIGFVLPSAVSRLGEAQESRIATASMAQADLDTLRKDLADQKAAVKQAEGWKASECATGFGPKCKAQTNIHAQRLAYQEKLEKQLADAHPVTTPWVPAWQPALLPLGLELAIIGCFAYGLGPLARRSAITEREEPLTIDEIDEVRRVLRITKADVDELRSQGKRQHEIAAHFGVNQGRISELMSGKRAEVYVH